jgi:hypothetical protein
MTISSETGVSPVYIGNGVTTAFAFTFKVFQSSDVLVVQTDTSGNETSLVLTTNYTVSLNSNQDTSPGGTVTLLVAPLTDYKIVISSQVGNLQPIDIENQGGFYADVIETGLDRLTILCRQLTNKVSRSLKIPLSDSSITTELPTASNRANKALVFDASGNVDVAVRSSVGALEVNAVATTNIQDSAVTAAKIASSAITTVKISDDAVTDAKLRNSAALSVIGRSANSVGDPADIVAASDGHILRRSGTSIGFGTLPSGSVSHDNLAASLRLMSNDVMDFRLSLTTAVPVTTSDVTGATTIYAVPYIGNSIALYDGTNWNIRTSAEFSLGLGTLTSGRPYDVFCYDNAGTPTLEFTSWTNDTTRATALVYQDGVLVRSGATTRRYLGTFYTTSTTATEDSLANRYLWNFYNQVPRPMHRAIVTSSYNYTTATWRQAEASSSNQLNFVLGVAGQATRIECRGRAANSSANVLMSIAIGYDQTDSGFPSIAQVRSEVVSQVANQVVHPASLLVHTPAAGRHYYSWLEFSAATGTTTWTNAATQGGIVGTIDG